MLLVMVVLSAVIVSGSHSIRRLSNLTYVNILLVLHNISTSQISGNILCILKAFLSYTRQGMKHRMATKRLSKIYIARCRNTWLDEANWPQEWPNSPIFLVYLKIPHETINLSVYSSLDFSLDINRF